MKRLFIILSLISLLATSFFTGCGGQKIRVGSYLDPEGMLMAQLILQMLAENGFGVIDAGAAENPHRELEDGKFDIYPEYTSSQYEAGDTANPNSGVVWLKPGPADSKWAIVVDENLSRAANINNMSDFAAYVNSKKGPVKLLSSPDFIADKTALPAFEQAYGFVLEPDQLVVIPNFNFVYMWTQVASPDNDINAAMAYTTGGNPEEYKVVLLDDDKGSQAEFHPSPIVRKEIYGKYAEQFNRILTPLFAALDDNTLRMLESQSGLSGKQTTAEVARNYLAENGYFKYNELQMVQKAMDEMMAKNGLTSVTAYPGATSDMSAFPDKEHALYSQNMLWPYMTWRMTTGTYTCDSRGIVTQVSTGW